MASIPGFANGPWSRSEIFLGPVVRYRSGTPDAFDMRRRDYLRATAGTAGLAVLAGCGAFGGDTGTLETRVSDQPGDIGDFETLELTITEIRPKPTDGEEATVDIEDVTVDLTVLTGDVSASLGPTELEAGDYEYLKLVVGSVGEARLTDGRSAEVTTPGEAPLKFNTEFPICTGGETTFTADFTPVKQGRSGRYVLKPVADRVEVETTCEDGTEQTTTS